MEDWKMMIANDPDGPDWCVWFLFVVVLISLSMWIG